MLSKNPFKRLPVSPNILPESPCWNAATQRLFWVDHATKVLNSFRFSDETGQLLDLDTNGNLRFVKSYGDRRQPVPRTRGDEPALWLTLGAG